MTPPASLPHFCRNSGFLALLLLIPWGTPTPLRAQLPGIKESAPSTASSLELRIEGPVSPELAPVAADLTRRFYEDYPKLLGRFDNPDKPGPRRIRIVFDEKLRIPAHCSGNTVTVGVGWLKKNPHDTPLLTHELTHAVQQYPQPNPGWLTEGIADYARHVYGPNPQQDWKLPDHFRPGQSYREGYRTTARFLLWVEEKHPGTVDQLHKALQNGKYQEDLWKQATGKTPDDLWKDCLNELRKVPE